VRLNGARIDAPAKTVRAGDVVTVSLPERVLVWKVLEMGERRGPAAEARLLYEDMSPAVTAPTPREAPSPGARPTKQERRAMNRLLGRDGA